MYSAVEFNLTVRSLAQFMKTHKNIGLVIIDGLHLIENVEMYSVKQSDKSAASGVNGSAGKPGRKGAANNVMAMAAQGDVPTSDDFFGGGLGASSTMAGTATPQSVKSSIPSANQTNTIR